MKQNSKSRYNPHIHNRQSRRLKGYDYSQPGSYFITFCTQNRECLFGEIINGQMHLNDIGKMIETEWLNLKTRFTNIELHAYVIMPDHFHGIIEITDRESSEGAPLVGAPSEDSPTAVEGAPTRDAPSTAADTPIPKKKTVGDMVGAFKSITTVNYIRGVNELGWPTFDGRLWERNYYERAIRNGWAFQNISRYIINNPAKWEANQFCDKRKSRKDVRPG